LVVPAFIVLGGVAERHGLDRSPKRLGSSWPGVPSIFFLLPGAFEGEVFDDIVVVLLQLGEQPFVGEIEWPGVLQSWRSTS